MHQKKYKEKYKKCYEWDVQRKVQEMLWMFMKWGHMYRGVFWPQEKKEWEFSTDTRMEAKPLKEAIQEGDIPSTWLLSTPSKS